jgi:hypothetical protein
MEGADREDLTEDDDDHFSDATEGRSHDASGHTSPVPRWPKGISDETLSGTDESSADHHTPKRLGRGIQLGTSDIKHVTPFQHDIGTTSSESHQPIPTTLITHAESSANNDEGSGSTVDAQTDHSENLSPVLRETITHSRRSSRSLAFSRRSSADQTAFGANEKSPDGFGDDFDDFGEGGGDEDFGDFGDDFEESGIDTFEPPAVAEEQSLEHLSILNFDELHDREAVVGAVEDFIREHIPLPSMELLPPPGPLSKDTSVFLSDRRYFLSSN